MANPGRAPRGIPRGRQLASRLIGALELPRDLLLDVPRVTVVGALQITVENHRGLLEYHPNQVVIEVAAGGRVRIEGTELEIGVVQAQEVTVTGQLRQVSFERGGDTA